MIRLLYRVYLWLGELARWSRRRLTPAGGFVAAGILVTAGAANTEQTQSMQACLLLSVLGGLAVIAAAFFRAKFSIARETPRFVTAGESFALRVVVTNRSGRVQRGLSYLENLRETPLAFADFVARLRPGRGNRSFRPVAPLPPVRGARTRQVALPDLAPGGSAEVRVEIVAWRRGPLLLAGGLVARTDPFGLFRAYARVEAPRTVLVLPRRYPLPRIDLPGQSHYQRGGVELASGVGEAEEFVALRDYRRGDSLRRVHWRSAARLGRLVVKEFQDEYLIRHALVLDTFCEASHEAQFEEAVAVAASFACTVPDQESLLDLLFVGPGTVCVTSGRGVGHSEQMLEVLAAVRPCREDRIAELETLILRHRVALSGALLVLLEWDDARRALVRLLKKSGLPLLVLLLVPPGQGGEVDAGPPGDRPDRLIRLESGRVAEGLKQLEARP